MTRYDRPAGSPAARQGIDSGGPVACDQYTSEPDYWEKVREFGDEPSTDLIYPEVHLGADSDRGSPASGNR
jgi:hypothetical protein